MLPLDVYLPVGLYEGLINFDTFLFLVQSLKRQIKNNRNFIFLRQPLFSGKPHGICEHKFWK